MEDIITIEDQIKFAFENFTKYNLEDQENLIKITLNKFKVNEMKNEVKKPLLFSLLYYYNNNYLKIKFDISNQIIEMISVLICDISLFPKIKESLITEEINLICNFIKITGLLLYNRVLRKMITSLHTDVAEAVVKKLLQNLPEDIISSDSLDEDIVRDIIIICHDTNFKKYGLIVNTIYKNEHLLKIFIKEIPEANKYMNLI